MLEVKSSCRGANTKVYQDFQREDSISKCLSLDTDDAQFVFPVQEGEGTDACAVACQRRRERDRGMGRGRFYEKWMQGRTSRRWDSRWRRRRSKETLSVSSHSSHSLKPHGQHLWRVCPRNQRSQPGMISCFLHLIFKCRFEC